VTGSTISSSSGRPRSMDRSRQTSCVAPWTKQRWSLQVSRIDLVCLGVGKGESYVMRGRPSTGFVLKVDGRPELLVDCGAGIALSYKRNIGGSFPPRVYISHNHIDHTGDLPIAVGYLDGDSPAVLGHRDVLDIVRQHRFHDAPETQERVTKRVAWITSDDAGVLEVVGAVSMQLFKTRHSYVCYGFMLLVSGREILGYSADSPYDEILFQRVTRAPVAILDGRDRGNFDHASLEEIDRFARKAPQCSIYVAHYEGTDYEFRSSNVHLLREGDCLPLASG
jgi:ribonuclease BN (tRNA processing enzyme)